MKRVSTLPQKEADVTTIESITVSPHFIATALIDGKSDLLVKTRPIEIKNETCYLVSQNKALGIIKLGDTVAVNGDAFKSLENRHLISEDTRKQWAEVQPTWNSDVLYYRQVEVLDKFDNPIDVSFINEIEKKVEEITEEIKKSDIEITTDIDIDGLDNEQLEAVHWKLHKMYGDNTDELSTIKITNLHSLIVDKLSSDGVEHPAPPDNGLDDLSSDFEKEFSNKNWVDKDFGFQCFVKKAVWSRAYINDLPDSAFLYVESGGKKDGEGKTAPRSLRHFPYKDATGKVDLPHLRNAIARIPQSKFGLSDKQISDLQNKARKILERETENKESVSKRRLSMWGSTAGKTRVAGRVVSMMPEHKTYIEPFAGGAAVFYRKERSEVEVLNDINPEIPFCLKFIQDITEDQIKKIQSLNWVCTRDQLEKVHYLKPKNDIERFYRFVYKRFASFYRVDTNIRGIDPSIENKRYQGPDRLALTKERLKGVKIHNDSYEKLFDKYDAPDSFFYLDPPYPERDQGVGEKEFDEDKFIEKLKSLKGKFILHYDMKAKKKFNELKKRGWIVRKLSTFITGGGSTGIQPGDLLEVMNYNPVKKSCDESNLIVPDESGTYRYVVQNHWCGKSLHSDFRVETECNKSLISWTMEIQKEYDIDKPVTTLETAKKLSGCLDNISKVDWKNNNWMVDDDSLPVEIVSKYEGVCPNIWLDIEGKTKDPVLGKASPIGGNPQYPGVFDIVDQGVVEYGVQKSDYREYFLKNGNFKGRLVFRAIKIEKTDRIEECLVCKNEGEMSFIEWDGDIIELCNECTDVFIKKNSGIIDKQLWISVRPKEQMPYILSDQSVQDHWIPPQGYSFLPVAIRKQIPDELKYWEKSEGEIETVRNELVKRIQSSRVEIDVNKGFSEKSEFSLSNAKFVLQRQNWSEPVQIGSNLANERWMIRLDIGEPSLLVLESEKSPIGDNPIRVIKEFDKHKNSMSLPKHIKPAHYINVSKALTSEIDVIDQGLAVLSGDSISTTEIMFKGKKLKGLHRLIEDGDGWLLVSDQGNLIDVPTKEFEFCEVETVKAEGRELRIVTGIVLEPNEVDAHKDWEKPETIRKTAHNFLTNYNRSTKLGIMHNMFGDIGVELVESYISPVSYDINGKHVKKGSWVMTVHVSDDNIWNKIKNKELTGFSIGGIATVEGK